MLHLLYFLFSFSSPVPEEPLSNFVFRKEALPDVLDQLVNEMGLPIIYQGQPASLLVSADCRSCSTEQGLEAVFRGTTATWERMGNHFLVRFDPLGTGRLSGRVFLEENNLGLGHVRVTLVSGPSKSASFTTGPMGNFQTGPLPTGSYRVLVEVQGFSTLDRGLLFVEEYRLLEVKLPLEVVALPTHEMVVTPGLYGLLEEPGTPSQYLDRRSLENTPHLGDDVLRTLAILPGANPDGISARPRPRGALEGEVRISLDGMKLIDPFHARELTGMISVVDEELVAGLDLISGGFTAEEGGALSGLVQMQSKVPSAARTSVGLSFINTRVSREGTLAGGRGHYLASARLGYLDPFLIMIAVQNGDFLFEDTVSPGYNDVFGKVSYALGERHVLGAHLLISNDEVNYDRLADQGRGGNKGTYSSTYSWLNLTSFWPNEIESETRLSFVQADSTKHLATEVPGLSLVYDDDRDLQDVGLDGDLLLARQGYSIKLGWSYHAQKARYDYGHFNHNEYSVFGPALRNTAANLDLQGRALGLYLAWRVRLGEHAVMELGGRYDNQDWIPGTQISPRFNLAWQLFHNIHLSLAWGRFHQGRDLYRLQVEDGQETFSAAPAAEHRLLGVIKKFDNGIETRMELFWNVALHPAARFENLWGGDMFMPQIGDDRIEIRPDGGAVRGLELSAQGRGRLDWLANYAWNEAWDEIDGVRRPRRREQRHTVNLNLGYQINSRWHLNLAWHYHSGWHTTELGLEDRDGTPQLVIGPINGAQLPDYQRLDLRLGRGPGGWGVSWYLDVVNAYNNQNLRGYASVLQDGQNNLVIDPETGLPLLFSFGVKWSR